MKKIFGFFKNVKEELKKVKWPEKKYILKYTIATLAFVIAFALYFLGINTIIAIVTKVWLA